MSHSNPDFSTINLDVLRKCRVYELPPSYRLQKESGNGCYGDAPGYPTYFTRSVYTAHGNTPHHKGRPTQVITYEGKHYVVQFNGQSDEAYRKLLHKLWKPLPLDHPRTQAFIRSRYSHHHNCYLHPDLPGDYGRGRKLVIFPVPYYELKSFHDDKRFSDEWRQKEQAAVEAHNNEVVRLAEAVAIPENHSAVVYIREFYPEHQPDLNLIADPKGERGDWWETSAERPTPETCPGIHGHDHRKDGWCQFCGYDESKA